MSTDKNRVNTYPELVCIEIIPTGKLNIMFGQIKITAGIYPNLNALSNHPLCLAIIWL